MKNEYFPYFVGIFAGVNECSFRNSCLSWLDLAILWPKVAKNYGISKIRVFLGLIFGISLAQGAEELWHSQNLCLSGADILTFLWPKVPKNHGVPEIRVFLHPEMLEFHVVGELSCRGLLTGNRMLNFVPFCYWKGAKFAGENIHILGNFDVRRPRFV